MSTSTDFQVNKNWLNVWEQNTLATGTDFGLTLNNLDFVVSAV